MSMFCYQCQETAKGTGCTIKGVCGKTDEVANLQDVLVHTIKGLSFYASKAAENGLRKEAVDKFMIDGLFTTITNANFDPEVIRKKVHKGLELKKELIEMLKESGVELSGVPKSANWEPLDKNNLEAEAISVGILSEKNEDVRSLKELVVYGVKGMAAYLEHALNLGFEDQEAVDFMHVALAGTLADDQSAEDLLALVMETGKNGVKAMALLDKANTSTYGNPEISKVRLGVRSNPGILISGHDLKDLEELLQQSEGTGVDVYTHSEMLPAHYYPAFKKYKHFAGNYGNAWWKQREEFEKFNGPILFTTNCLVPPPKNAAYADKVYTTGSSGFPGFTHIPDREEGKAKDFSTVIEHAKKCKPPVELETGEITGGFAHAQVFQLADKIVDAVKSGAIKKFFVMAGCDGRIKSREYYTEFADKLPKDTVILTAGCAKYRYNKLPLGDIGGIPRVLDAGQCNDSYSLALIALKLKEVFELNDVNDLPIAYNIAWYEQKAVIVLLALLYLGVKNIHLGPTLPAFLSPKVAEILTEQFGIAGISEAEKDVAMFMNVN